MFFVCLHFMTDTEFIVIYVLASKISVTIFPDKKIAFWLVLMFVHNNCCRKTISDC